MNIKNLFTEQYLFEINPVIFDRSDKIFLLVGALSVVLAALFKIAALMSASPIDYKHRQRFYQVFLTLGICELIWYGARVEHVRFFGSHFVAWVILVICAVWFVWVAAIAFKNYSKEKTVWEKEQVKLKYLTR